MDPEPPRKTSSSSSSDEETHQQTSDPDDSKDQQAHNRVLIAHSKAGATQVRSDEGPAFKDQVMDRRPGATISHQAVPERQYGPDFKDQVMDRHHEATSPGSDAAGSDSQERLALKHRLLHHHEVLEPSFKDQAQSHAETPGAEAVAPDTTRGFRPGMDPNAYGPTFKGQVRSMTPPADEETEWGKVGEVLAARTPSSKDNVQERFLPPVERREPSPGFARAEDLTDTTALITTSSPTRQVDESPTAGDILVSAVVVQPTVQPKLAEATPVRQINRRRLAAAILGLAIIIAAVIVSVVLTLGENDGTNNKAETDSTDPDFGPNMTPSFTPTTTPSDYPRDWIQLGDEINRGDSDDEGGRSIAISRNGLSIALGSPSEEMVYVYTYGMGRRWLLQAKIDGVLLYEATGRSVAVDDSGSIVAVGAPYVIPEDPSEDPDATPQRGRVRVFRIINATGTTDNYGDYVEDNYQQIGSDIVGTERGDEFGWSVDISDDGQIVAIGSRSQCIVRVLRYSKLARDWVDYFPEIDCAGQSYDDSFGSSVRLSSDGTVLAVGEPLVELADYDDNVEEARSGRVLVFHFNGSSWEQFGQTLEREVGDAFGTSLALSDNGKILAIGAPFNDVGREQILVEIGTRDPAIGSCRVYEYNTTSERWQQLGPDINGDELFGQFGSSVSLDSDGKTLAVGAVGSDKYGRESGLIRVLQYDMESDDWVQVGQDIAGPFPGARAGMHVAISARGDIVTIGSPHRFDSPTMENVYGTARVYETAVLLPGSFPITVVLYADYLRDEDGWSMERLDVERQETVFVAAFTDLDVKNQTNATTVMVSEGGVYRFVVFGDNVEEYKIVLSDTVDEGEIIVRGSGNFTDYSQHSFIAAPPSSLPSAAAESTFVTLKIHFDARPWDIHWVLVAIDIVIDSQSKRPRKEQTVLAFGPEQEYGSDLARQTYTQTIDVSSVSQDTKMKFILSDTGRDGLCCDNGVGSYTLYSGSSIDSAESILFSSRATRERREVHTFSLADTGGPTLAPSTISPTAAPSDTPTPRPTSVADVAARAGAITVFINNITLADFDIFYPPSSTENATTEELAMKWLIEEDPLRLSVDTPEERFRLQQRYAILTLLFQSKDDPWIEPQWDDDEDPKSRIEEECEWTGISCERKDVYGGVKDIQNVVDRFRLGSGFSSFRIPVDVALLPYIDRFDVSLESSQSNFLPPSIGNLGSLQNLRTLSIGWNSFSGTLPSSLARLTSLRKFSAGSNAFTGSIPDLGQWTNLEYFDLSGNSFSGTLPESIGAWTDLEYFYVGNNALNGPLPPLIEKWSNLWSFAIYNNALTGSIPSEIRECTTLRYFQIHNNSMKGSLPSSIGELSNLRRFSIYNNTFSGTLPSSIGGWTSIRSFEVHDNMLSGSLPTSLRQWNDLWSFSIHHNAFSGTLPSSAVAEWTSLNFFDIHENRLSGSIPATIDQWRYLRTFSIYSNAFSGALPGSLGQLKYLKVFDVSQNYFNGTIPESIGNWSYIESASFSGNNFTGTMPLCAVLTSLANLVHLEADCAKVDCPCCTVCA